MRRTSSPRDPHDMFGLFLDVSCSCGVCSTVRTQPFTADDADSSRAPHQGILAEPGGSSRSATIPLRRGLRPGARRARLGAAARRQENPKTMNERILVRDADTGDMMEMCLKTGHLLKLGSPPIAAGRPLRPPAAAQTWMPEHLRPKPAEPVAPPLLPAATPPTTSSSRIAVPTPPLPAAAGTATSSTASTPASSPKLAKRRGSLLEGVHKLFGRDGANPVADLDACLGRLATLDLPATERVALALKLRAFADRLEGCTPRAASPAAFVSTPAQDGFRYRFEPSAGDAQQALRSFALATPEWERRASTSPAPSPEATACARDVVNELLSYELVEAVRAEAVRRASSVEDADAAPPEAAASASDDDAPPRAVSPTLEAARPISPVLPTTPDAVEPPPPARAVEPYRPTTRGAAMLDAIVNDIANLETALEADEDDGFASFEAAPASPAADDDDDGFACFEAAPASPPAVDARPASTPHIDAAPAANARTTQSPFEAAIAARRAQTDPAPEADRRPETRMATVQ